MSPHDVTFQTGIPQTNPTTGRHDLDELGSWYRPASVREADRYNRERRGILPAIYLHENELPFDAAWAWATGDAAGHPGDRLPPHHVLALGRRIATELAQQVGLVVPVKCWRVVPLYDRIGIELMFHNGRKYALGYRLDMLPTVFSSDAGDIPYLAHEALQIVRRYAEHVLHKAPEQNP